MRFMSSSLTAYLDCASISPLAFARFGIESPLTLFRSQHSAIKQKECPTHYPAVFFTLTRALLASLQSEYDQSAPYDKGQHSIALGSRATSARASNNEDGGNMRTRLNRTEGLSNRSSSGRRVECPPPRPIGGLRRTTTGNHGLMAENRAMGPHCSDCGSYCQNTPQWGLSAPQRNAPEEALEIRKARLNSFDLAF